jgi:hypothetical protein
MDKSLIFPEARSLSFDNSFFFLLAKWGDKTMIAETDNFFLLKESGNKNLNKTMPLLAFVPKMIASCILKSCLENRQIYENQFTLAKKKKVTTETSVRGREGISSTNPSSQSSHTMSESESRTSMLQ